MSIKVGLLLEALDVLFFRDGRPFAAAGRAASGLPMPQTIAGALRTALLEAHGCDFARMHKIPSFSDAVRAGLPRSEDHWIAEVSFRGPWLARWVEKEPDKGLESRLQPERDRRKPELQQVEVLVPAPAVLHGRKKQQGDELYRLTPLGGNLPGWKSDDQHGLRPLWLRREEPTEAVDGFLAPAGLAAFLRGECPTKQQVVRRDQLLDFDHRTGIGIEPDRLSAQESQIYAASFLALRPKVGLYVEVVLPVPEHKKALERLAVLALGGEGRRARVTVLPEPFAWPSAPATSRTLLLLTTPGLFQERWRPGCLGPPRLAAAAVPGAVAFSGWDLARGGPKRTRFAAGAGSVYFLDGTPAGLPSDAPSLCDAAEDRALGWGCYLKGAWNDA